MKINVNGTELSASVDEEAETSFSGHKAAELMAMWRYDESSESHRKVKKGCSLNIIKKEQVCVLWKNRSYRSTWWSNNCLMSWFS